MNLKSASTNGFNIQIINSFRKSWGYAWCRLTVMYKRNNQRRTSLEFLVEAGRLDWVTKNLSILSGANLQYSSKIFETETVSLELSWKFLTFTIHTFVLGSLVPLSFPYVEPCIYWRTGTIVVPKSTLGKGKRTQVNIQDFLRVL